MLNSGFLKKHWVEMVFVGLMVLLVVAGQYGIIPSMGVWLGSLRELYLEHSFTVIFLVGLVEGFLWTGLYFPGSLIAAYGVYQADGDVGQIATVIFAFWLSLTIINCVNYFIGFRSYIMDPEKGLTFRPARLTVKQWPAFLHPTGAATLAHWAGRTGMKPGILWRISVGLLIAGISYGILITALAHLLTPFFG